MWFTSVVLAIERLVLSMVLSTMLYSSQPAFLKTQLIGIALLLVIGASVVVWFSIMVMLGGAGFAVGLGTCQVGK